MVRPLGWNVALSVGLLAVASAACEAPRGEPRASAMSVEPATEGGSSSSMSRPSFERAEALLAGSQRRWVAVSATPAPIRWSRPDVAFGEYRTEPDSQVRVFVHVFATAASAAAAMPELRLHTLDGARSRLVQNGELVFWFECPVALPGRPFPPDTNATFDAAVASVGGG